ncbi:MAG: macro domain-containing protein [Planctomycetota bacterium]|nr:macro domain-containing protein [Planctomycetota bacterium]
MKIVRGDIIKLALAGAFDVIVHGCNCMCTMGAGIAKGIKATFPEAHAADCATPKGAKEKLGTISTARVQRDGLLLHVVNGYTQLHWRGKKPLADYDAIRSVMREVGRRFEGQRIGYPRIGAGLAGGDWEKIAPIIDAELEGQDHTLVEFDPDA